MLNAELKSKINQLWDRFWAGGLANPLIAIEQISYLIFMKRLEELDNKHQNEALGRGEKYESVFKGNEDCRWSNWKHYSAEQMITHVRDKACPIIKNIRRGGDTAFSENMKDANFSIPKPSLLQEAVSIIDELYENAQQHNGDTLGDIYEYLLSELQSSGKNGQFRTPRHIIRMMVKLVDPQLNQTICDPACGTAGFLVNAYNHILEKNKKNGVSTLKPNQKEILDTKSIYGYDIDETMTRIALMNLMMHGIQKP